MVNTLKTPNSLPLKRGRISNFGRGSREEVEILSNSKSLHKEVIEQILIWQKGRSFKPNLRRRVHRPLLTLNLNQESHKTSTKKNQGKEIAYFKGYVKKIEGNDAYVSLTSSKNEYTEAIYPCGDLVKNNIHEQDFFELRLLENGDSINFDLKLAPRPKIDLEKQRAIREEIEKALGGYIQNDDY